MRISTWSRAAGSPSRAAQARRPPAKGTEERRFTISEAGSGNVRGAGATTSPGSSPPSPTSRRRSRSPRTPKRRRAARCTPYKLEDDYGVVDAQATFKRRRTPARNGHRRAPLFGAPDFPLVLPQARTKNGVGQTIKDLTEHPGPASTWR